MGSHHVLHNQKEPPVRGQWGLEPGAGSPSRTPGLSVSPPSRLADWQQTATEHLVRAKHQASRSLLSTQQGPRQTGACWLRRTLQRGWFSHPCGGGQGGIMTTRAVGVGHRCPAGILPWSSGLQAACHRGQSLRPLFHPWGGAGQGVLLPRSLSHQAPNVPKNPLEKLAHLWVGKVSTSLSLS